MSNKTYFFDNTTHVVYSISINSYCLQCVRDLNLNREFVQEILLYYSLLILLLHGEEM